MLPELAIREKLMERRDWYAGLSEGPEEPASATVADIVSTLERDGLYIAENFVDRAEALNLGRRLLNLIENVVAGHAEIPNKVYHFPEPGICRILKADLLDSAAAEFFNHDLIQQVARSYTCRNIVSWQRMVETRSKRFVHGPSDAYHIDEAFYFKFKAFLYLNDVSETTAPFDCIVGSHASADWREPKERQMLRYELEGEDAVYGLRGNFLDDREIDYLMAKYGYRRHICSGQAGTLVLTDTRGIHKATTPVTGGRTMLEHYFELPRNAQR